MVNVTPIGTALFRNNQAITDWDFDLLGGGDAGATGAQKTSVQRSVESPDQADDVNLAEPTPNAPQLPQALVIAPQGGETVANQLTPGFQTGARITYLTNGKFVLTWVTNAGASPDDIQARIFNADGTPFTNEFTVNASTGGNQVQADVAALAGGGFAVVWYEASITNGDLRGRVYDAAGTALTGNIAINDPALPQSAAGQVQAAIVGLSGGRFAVTWADNGGPETGTGASLSQVRARVFEANGTPVAGSESQVNTTAASFQHYPAIAKLGIGYVVVWQDNSGAAGAGEDIRAQRFDVNGARVGTEILITSTSGAQSLPSVVELAGGGFAVAWTDPSGTGGDTSGTSIKARIFTAAGVAVGSEFLVNATIFSDQSEVALAQLPDGGFVATWSDNSQTGGDATGTAIRSRAFDANGVGGTERLVNTTTAGAQNDPAIAADSSGNHTIAFVDFSTGTPDIRFQRFSATAPNVAPAGTDATLTINEDAARVLTVADFGFTDTDGNALLSVGITTLPAAGTIRLNGTAVTAGTFVTAADINAGLLVYTPGTNGNGAAYSSFTFQVRDNGGGTDTDLSANTITFDVTAVNDAPTITNLQGDVSTQTEGLGGTTYADAGRNAVITDVDSANFDGGRLTVTVTTGFQGDQIAVIGDGILAVGAGNVVTVSGQAIGVVSGGAYGSPRTATMTIDLNGAATIALVQTLLRGIFVRDSRIEPLGGTRAIEVTLTDGDGGSSSYTSQVDVIAINDEPAGGDRTITINEDVARTLTATDFSFDENASNTFSEGQVLQAVIITTLPTAGTLTLNGAAVAAGQAVTAAQIAANQLVFTPATNANGIGHAGFTFQVQDNGGTSNGGIDTDQSANTLTFNVAAVNDAPTVTITTGPSLGGMGMAAQWTDLESGSGELPANVWGNGATSSANRIGMTVTFGNGLTGSVIYNNVSGLWNNAFNGIAYESATGFFTAAQRLHLLFDNGSTLPMAWEDFSMAFSSNFDLDYSDQNGSHFRADFGGWESAVFRTFTSTATGGGASFDVTEQTASSLKGSIVLADVDADSSVVTATLTVVYGVLNIGVGSSGATIVSGNGTDAVVVSGTIAQLNDLLGSNSSSVVNYTADSDTPPSSSLFTISVNDNGNTGTGGAQTGSASQTITITAVNDTPSGSDATVVIDEDTARLLTVADFGFADLDGNALLSVGITTLPGAGTITLNGTPVTAGTFVTVADINAGLLAYTPGSNGNGMGYSSFTFQVRDDGGSADTDLSANTLTFDVTSVIDAPVVANLQGDTVSFTEGGAQFSAPLDVGLNALVTDADNANFNGGSLNITVTGGNAAEDFIYFNNSNPAFGLTFSGNTISQGGVAFATFNAPGSSRTFTFLNNGSATPARVEQLVRSLSYFNNNGYNPSEGAHTVTYTLIDGSGGTSVTTSTVNVIGTNTAPILDLNTGAAGVDDTNAYFENSFASGIGSNIAISDDGNLTRATVTITDAVAGDALTVNLPLPTGISVDPASTATTLILIGNASASAFATALGQVGYLSNSDNPTVGGTDDTRLVEVVVSDGTLDSAPATMTISLAAVNDAPVVTLSFNAPVIDQSALDLSGGHNISSFVQANNFTVSGPTTLNQFTVFLAENTVATAGTFEGFGGTLSFAIYRDNGSGLPGTLVLTGSDAAPVATDTGLDLGGRDLFQFVVNLGGIALTGGNYWIALHEGSWLSPSDGTDLFWSRSANDTNNNQRAITSNVTAPDGTFATFTPGLAFAIDGTRGATEQTAFDLKGKISVADGDAGSAVVTATLSVDYGTLKVNVGTSGATIVSGSGTGTVVLSGTIAQLNALLRTDATSAIRYTANTDAPPGSTTLTVSVDDGGSFGSGGAQTGMATQTIIITAVDDVPVVDLNGAAAGIDTTGSYTEGGTPIRPLLDMTITDVDSATLTGATVTIGTGFVAGDLLRLAGGFSGTTGSGITYNYNNATGVLTLSGTASVADYQTTLAALAFKSNSDDPGTARDITVVVNDGSANSVAAHILLTVSPVNDAPVNIVPGAQFGAEGSPIVFSTANGNAVSVSDPDAGSGVVRVRLSVDHGTLTLASSVGVIVTGDSTGVLKITGTLAAVNAALDGLTYQPATGYVGSDALAITTNDTGNTGSGGPLTDTDSVAIIVNGIAMDEVLSDKLFADDQASNVGAAFTSNDNNNGGNGGNGALDGMFYPGNLGHDSILASSFLV